jgi:predicted DNA-binding transcriptional regulator YafY
VDVRASRLLSLLLLLQARGRMTAAQLAGELEVSVRTVYRDVESLNAAGVPLYGDAGRDGGYRLLDGYRTQLTGLTGAEAEVLFLGGLPGPVAELGLGAALTAAELKIKAALPAPLRDRAERIQRRFHLDVPAWYRARDDTGHLAAVADAVWTQRSVRMQYRRWAAPTEVTRMVDPLGIVLKAGRWYLVARSGAQTRTYRIAQILALDVLDARFERPAEFDLGEYWRCYVEDFETRRHRGEALVRISPGAAERLPDLLDTATVSAVARTAEPDTGGWIRVRIPVETVDHAAGELLQLGARVEVLAPPELRQRLTEIAEDLSRLYRAGPHFPNQGNASTPPGVGLREADSLEPSR